jgi:hypothetical protein
MRDCAKAGQAWPILPDTRRHWRRNSKDFGHAHGLERYTRGGNWPQRRPRPISPDRWRGRSSGKTPLPCRIIPLSEATLMATQRRFVQRRIASHAVFSRIRSSFRNPVISSLSTAFPYAKGPRAKNSPALHEGIVRSGQEIGRRIGYHQVTEFDASAPSRRRSRACLALTSRRGVRRCIEGNRPFWRLS